MKIITSEILLQIESSYPLGLMEQLVFLLEGTIIIISSFCVILSRTLYILYFF